MTHNISTFKQEFYSDTIIQFRSRKKKAELPCLLLKGPVTLFQSETIVAVLAFDDFFRQKFSFFKAIYAAYINYEKLSTLR